MGWRDRLQAASFRGVAFEYRSDDLSGIGRRNQSYEYPKREQGYVEDMGRGVERIDIEAILIGKEYLTQLDALLKALRATGPGELVHPFYGRLQMVADASGRVRHSFEDGGMCTVSMSFVEAGENKYPAGQEIPAIKVVSFVDRLQAKAWAEFNDIFGAVSLPEWVSVDALTDIGGVLSDVQGVYGRVLAGDVAGLLGGTSLLSGVSLPSWVSVDALADIAGVVGVGKDIYSRVLSGTWTDLLGNAGGLALGLMSTVTSFARSLRGGSGSSSSYSRLLRGDSGSSYSSSERFSPGPQVVALQLAKGFSAQLSQPLTVLGSPAQRQSQINSAAIQRLVTHATIGQAAREIVAVEQPVYDDLQHWHGELTAVVDRELERPGLPQSTFDALADLRGAVGRYVLSESASASRLKTYTPPTTLPAVVLAYDLYEDATRSDELVRRNGLQHPGFVPPEPLKVLNA